MGRSRLQRPIRSYRPPRNTIVPLAALVALILSAAVLYYGFLSPLRQPECVSTIGLDLALARSRNTIFQVSADDAPGKCAAYRAYVALLESRKRCSGISIRSSGSLASELAAYQLLAAKTCAP